MTPFPLVHPFFSSEQVACAMEFENDGTADNIVNAASDENAINAIVDNETNLVLDNANNGNVQEIQDVQHGNGGNVSMEFDVTTDDQAQPGIAGGNIQTRTWVTDANVEYLDLAGDGYEEVVEDQDEETWEVSSEGSPEPPENVEESDPVDKLAVVFQRVNVGKKHWKKNLLKSWECEYYQQKLKKIEDKKRTVKFVLNGGISKSNAHPHKHGNLANTRQKQKSILRRQLLQNPVN